MPIIKAVKRFFGFETDDQVGEEASMGSDLSEEQYRDASVIPLKEQHQHQSQEQADTPQEQAEVSDDDSDDDDQDPKLLEIFDGILNIFNQAQPEFIRDTLDRDAQRHYLYEALQTSVDGYIESLAEEARDKARKMDRKERQRLQADLQSLREREKQAEQVIAEQQTKQLSAQRQKRALTQRIEDNEKRIAALEAEKEQSDLQIRSLINKLKVAEVKDGDLSAQRDEIEDLRNDVSAKNAENTRLNQILEQQKSEIDDLKKALEATQEQIPDAAMMQMTEEDRKVLMEVQNEISRFENIKKAKDSKIASQKKQIVELTGQVSAQASQLNTSMARVAELESQLEALQGMLQDLQSSSALDESLRAREDMIQSTAPVETEQQSEAGDANKAKSGDSVAPAKRTKAKRKPKVSAIDENLESVNWLLTVPSDENPAPSVGAPTSDADFGYQPPVKKEIASNDAQLTLF